MCGISGIIDKSKKEIEESEIKNMNDLISHRGPDDEGYYLKNNFAFGHRRLAILDLSHAGHQPMKYKGNNTEYVITYNGEIYNYIEIKDELIEDGYSFVSDTDTEVILASYDKWGEDCVNKFNGMWAFAIYDKRKDIIFCSRDRFGIKPFYYTEVDGRFIFGSEIKQLLEFHKITYANKVVLGDYLLYGLEEHTNETFFKDVYKLEQSHNIIYDLKLNQYQIKKYFNLEITKDLNQLSEDESIKYIENKLYNAVELRLRSDVRVGTCLSGGLDSSSIAAIASKKYYKQTGEKFVAIHAKSIERKTDESHFALKVANHCGLDIKIVKPTLEDIKNNVNEVFYTQEEPFGGPSIFMQYFVMKKAKESNCIVMLDGQGGDETLFGYEHYYSIYFAGLLKKFYLITFLKEFISLEVYKISKKQILKSIASVFLGNKTRYIKKILGLQDFKLKYSLDETRLNKLFEFKIFKDFQIRELSLRNLPHLLKYEDKNSMRHSIETRLPFVDYQFAKAAISVNDGLKFKNGYLKYLLRKIVVNILPKDIVWRTNKFGFEAPTNMWIDNYKNDMIVKIKKSAILKQSIDINTSALKDYKILWRLYSVAVWEEVYKVKFN